MIAIKTENLTKKFKDLVAVDSVNLSIKQGEVFSLLGVNGAGKTTIIKMLTCLLTPTSGDATLLGKNILTDSQEIKQFINISPQETAVAPNLSVKENLEFIASIYGIERKLIQEKVSEIISRFGLNKVINKRAKLLSGGMQRRLSIAMALISEPKILFLDEPTLGLDVIARHELWDNIKNLKEKITIILTTHYMEEAEELSDRIAILVDGKLKEIGTKKQLLEKSKTKKLEDAFIFFSNKKGEIK